MGTYTGEVLILNALENAPEVISLHNNAIKNLIGFKNYLITVCANGEICKYDFHSNQKITILGHLSIINSCCKVKNRDFVTVARDKKLKFWNSEQLACIKEIVTPHTHSIKTVATSTSGQYIATGDYFGEINILDQKTQRWFKKRVTTAGISCIKFDELNNQFIAGSFDGNIYFSQLRELP